MSLKDLLGGKGANLAEMTSVLGLPVPPGFTISTDACRAYMSGGWPEGLDDEVPKHVKRLEKAMKKKRDERFAYDSYRRFISMYGRIVLGIEADEFDTPFEAAKERTHSASDAEI